MLVLKRRSPRNTISFPRLMNQPRWNMEDKLLLDSLDQEELHLELPSDFYTSKTIHLLQYLLYIKPIKKLVIHSETFRQDYHGGRVIKPHVQATLRLRLSMLSPSSLPLSDCLYTAPLLALYFGPCKLSLPQPGLTVSYVYRHLLAARSLQYKASYSPPLLQLPEILKENKLYKANKLE